jgi:hypothetical protein
VSSRKRNGVKGFNRDEGVGVETANGSLDANEDVQDAKDDLHEVLFDPLKGLALEEGRSSSDGDAMPSSLCKKSICTNVVDSCCNRFVCWMNC